MSWKLWISFQVTLSNEGELFYVGFVRFPLPTFYALRFFFIKAAKIYCCFQNTNQIVVALRTYAIPTNLDMQFKYHAPGLRFWSSFTTY